MGKTTEARYGGWHGCLANPISYPKIPLTSKRKRPAVKPDCPFCDRIASAETIRGNEHAVAFPDVVVGEGLPGLDKPRRIILDKADLSELSRWVGGVLAYYRGKASQRETAPGDDAVQALIDILGKSRDLRPALWGDFLQEREQFISLTEQQYLILDALQRQRRAAICGCAGSGKTMMAAEKATRLARQDSVSC